VCLLTPPDHQHRWQEVESRWVLEALDSSYGRWRVTFCAPLPSTLGTGGTLAKTLAGGRWRAKRSGPGGGDGWHADENGARRAATERQACAGKKSALRAVRRKDSKSAEFAVDTGKGCPESSGFVLLTASGEPQDDARHLGLESRTHYVEFFLFF
jgi:hypothetical protein